MLALLVGAVVVAREAMRGDTDSASLVEREQKALDEIARIRRNQDVEPPRLPKPAAGSPIPASPLPYPTGTGWTFYRPPDVEIILVDLLPSPEEMEVLLRVLHRERMHAAGTDATSPAAMVALVRAYLDLGMGAEALFLLDRYEDLVRKTGPYETLVFEAAVAGLDFERAAIVHPSLPLARFGEGTIEEELKGGHYRRFATAHLAFDLATGSRCEMFDWRVGAFGFDIDAHARVFAAWRAKERWSVYDDLLGLTDWDCVGSLEGEDFDVQFGIGQKAEARGDPAEALYRYCRAIVEVRGESRQELLWHGEELGRKARYLSAIEGVVDSGLLAASSIEEPEKQARTRIEILQRAGRWPEAAGEWERLAADPKLPHALRIEAALACLEAGDPARAEEILAPLRSRGDGDPGGRVALRLAGAEPGSASEGIILEAALFLSFHELLEPARAEWEALLDGETTKTHALTAFEHLARIHARMREYASAADFLQHVLCMEYEESWRFARGGRERARARLEWFRAMASIEKGELGAATRALRRALGVYPYDVEAALLLARFVRESEPGLAERTLRVAREEIERRAVLEPLNPEVRELRERLRQGGR